MSKGNLFSAHTEDWESKTKMFSDLIFDSKRMALCCSLLVNSKWDRKLSTESFTNPSEEAICKGHNNLQWTTPDILV